MKTKSTLLSIAIIAALPFTANATGPAHYYGDSPVVATVTAPYQTATIGEHDDEHIATTAYVKGAYNDAIAAVNKVDSQFNDMQGQLMNNDTERSMESDVFGASSFVNDVLDGEDAVGHWEETLVSAAGVWAGIDHQLDKKRVDIYTTWGSNDTTQVQLSNVRTQ